MIYIILSMIFLLNMIMIFTTNPIPMGLTLMIQTILIAIFMGNIFSSFWFSYILVLIFLGGLLVLFIYVASLASNEMFTISFKFLIPMGFLIFISFIPMMDNTIFPLKNKSSDISQSLYEMNYLLQNSLSKFYLWPTLLSTIILIMYLLFTLVAVVNITKMDQGPLRMQL
uniref:NADH-ubiquinone oxidoreductase chain 6 n=1 Tax=Songmachilis xinxiangensis TaxID=1224734 RepID=R4IKJ4_9INSE|nr:NADH dehydrogenase subunit 6 [Songmachilis xinxiangensis]AFQ07911.1 NADH dehydrogenase subunit 6 [Songmachilis xinxiangensis]